MSFLKAHSVAHASPAKRHQRADIQGLRGLAVTLVVLYHMGLPIPGGFTGVDMFFVISGYVIMESLIREYRLNGSIRFGAFFLRRFKRLFPALIVLVAVVLLVATVFLPPFANENRALLTGLGAIFISANVVIDVTTGDYFSPDARLNPLLHTWSLSVEEQFYLFFPLLVLVGLWWGAKRGGALLGVTIAVGLVTVVSFALAVLGTMVSLPVGNSLLGFYSPVTRAWEFGVGALLSLAGSKLIAPQGVFRHIVAWGGVALIAVGAVAITSGSPFPGLLTLLPVLGTALAIYAGRGDQGVVNRALSVRPVTWLGDLSYSLYLWHWPLIVFAIAGWSADLDVMVIAVAIALVLSWLSYRFIEHPLRNRPTPTPRSIVKYIALVTALPGIAIVVTWLVASRILLPRIEEVVGSPLEKSTPRDATCLDDSGFVDSWAERCTWFPDAPGDPVYLIGDSTATHLGEGLILAGEELGRPVKIWNGILCIPLDDITVLTPEGERDNAHCPDYQLFIDEKLRDGPPGTVIIAFSDITQLSEGTTFVLADGTTAQTADEKGFILEKPLTDFARQLQDWGHDTVLVYSVPNFRAVGPGFSPRSCTLWELFGDTCAPHVPRTEMVELQEEKREAIANAALASGSPTIDLFDRYCTDTTCSPSRDRFLTYRDDTHISAAESASLAPLFVEVLTSGVSVSGFETVP